MVHGVEDDDGGAHGAWPPHTASFQGAWELPERGLMASDEGVWDPRRHAEPPSAPLGPHFVEGAPTVVTAAVGGPAVLPCKARNLGSKSVS